MEIPDILMCPDSPEDVKESLGITVDDPVSVDQLFQYLIERKGVSTQVRDVVPIRQWITSPYYLGDEAATLYPYWRDVIVEFIEGDYNELILGGSLRSGKSNTALLITLRKIYELSCFSPIPSLFELSSSSLILFMYLSLSLLQANLLGMGRIRRMIDKIPYFMDNFPLDPAIQSYIKFTDPSLLMLGGSDLGHFKGSDLFLLIFDEANFTKAAQEMKLQKAINIYRESSIRRKSTFIVDGQESGIGIIVSSADTVTSFVEDHKEKVKHDPNVMVVDSIAYEVQPQRYKDVGRFWVCKGDDVTDPFLIEDVTALRNFCSIHKLPFKSFDLEKLSSELKKLFIEVPKTFIEAFRLDITGALKEVCGVSIGVEGRFFFNRVKFAECFPVESADQHPFTQKELTCSYLDRDQLRYHLKPGALELNPAYEYYGHIDQSITTDSTGLALCHINPEEKDPKIEFDVMLRVNPPKKPAEISPDKIVDFFIFLHEHRGARNMKVTADWYALAQSRQKLIVNGIESEHLSVDKTWDQYRSFAGSIFDNRVQGYHYEPFKKEFFTLLQDNEKKKIDHPSGGCIAGETRIVCLDGISYTIKELAEKGGSVWVYTVRDKKISIAQAVHPRLTDRNVELVEVELDNFTVVRCTPDHRFMMRDGSYKSAGSLKRNDSLMPLNLKYMPTGGWAGYLRYYDLDGSREMVHKLVTREIYGEPKGRVSHHINEVKLNNLPSNLVYVYHMSKRHKDPLFKAKLRQAQYVDRVQHDEYRNSERGRRISSETIKRVHPERYKKIANHKVLNVRSAGQDDVYDITVPETENFGLANGIFIHNSKDVGDGACGAHWNAFQAILEIKGGLRFMSEFGARNISVFRFSEESQLYAGVFFDPSAFYVCWLFLSYKNEQPRVHVLEEKFDYQMTNEQRVTYLKRRAAHYNRKDCVFATGPKAREKSDITGSSPLKDFRTLGLSMRCREHMDPDNFDVIRNLLKDKENPRLFVNEHEAPLMLKAFGKAKYKIRSGMRTTEMEKTEHSFPLYALRFILEEIMSKSKVTAY